MNDLVISADILTTIQLTPDEVLEELAVHLYNTERISIGQAKSLSGLNHLEFQAALASRNLELKIDVEDFERDLSNLSFFKAAVDANRQ